jgi:hypothetical protein
MNFFQTLVSDLKGPMGTLNSQELGVVGPALAAVIPAALANPTKAGLIAAAAPAIVKIAAAQPQLLVELITDLVTAVGQIQAVNVQAPVAQQFQIPPLQAAMQKVG